ncbi:MAG: hypothetical protein AAF499_00715 [Pseudomonadota bacterium]
MTLRTAAQVLFALCVVSFVGGTHAPAPRTQTLAEELGVAERSDARVLDASAATDLGHTCNRAIES